MENFYTKVIHDAIQLLLAKQFKRAVLLCLFRLFYAIFCLIRVSGQLSSLLSFPMPIKWLKARGRLWKYWHNLRAIVKIISKAS
jgi:hypothetical protein